MLLQLKNISKGYGVAGTNSYRSVLDSLNFTVSNGDKVAIVGESGSGKTTLLNLIGTLDLPDSGNILFQDKDLTTFSTHDLAAFRNLNLGFIFQMHHLFPQLTLKENVLLPLLAANKSVSSEQNQWADYLIQKVGIWEQKNQKPSELSGGECQRTAVVRALINKPKLILADEPTGALDEKKAKEIARLLVNLCNEEGATLITVTHSADLAGQMDRILTLNSGKLV